MRALVLREIQSFFSSLLGYTVVAVFLLFSSLFLWLFPGGWNILDSGMASLDPFFAMAPWVLMFLIPAVTMRSFAEEHRAGTLELLLTRPLTEGQVVLAKFLGAWAVSLAALIPTFAFVLVVGMLGRPAWKDLGRCWVVHRPCRVFRCADGHWVGGVKLHNATVVGFFGRRDVHRRVFGWRTAILHGLGLGNMRSCAGHGIPLQCDEPRPPGLTMSCTSCRGWRCVLVFGLFYDAASRLVRGHAWLVTAVLTVLIVLGQLVHGDVDLTAEKRHTLAAGTTELLEESRRRHCHMLFDRKTPARVEAP